MLRTQLANLGNEFVVHVGTESLPVEGSAESGWAIIAAREMLAFSASEDGGVDYRYETLDELLFALINLSLVSDAEA